MLRQGIYLALAGGFASAVAGSLVIYLVLGLSFWLTEDIYRMMRLLLPTMVAVGVIVGLVAAHRDVERSGCLVAIIASIAWLGGFLVGAAASEILGVREILPYYILIVVFGVLGGILLDRLLRFPERTR